MKHTPLTILVFCLIVYSGVFFYERWEKRRADAEYAQVYALANKLLAEQGKPPLPPPVDVPTPTPSKTDTANTKPATKSVRQFDGTMKEVPVEVNPEATPLVETPDLKPGDKLPTTPMAGDIAGKTPKANPEPPDLSKKSSASSTIPHREFTGLKFEGKSPQSSFKLTPNSGTSYFWYTSDGESDMGWLNVKGIQGVIVQTDGPAIFEVITRKAGNKAIIERFKKDYGNATKYCPWDEKNKKWLSPIPFSIVEHTKGTLEQIRVLKDKEDLSPIMIEVGIPTL